MNRLIKLLYLFILVTFIFFGCSPHVPKSEYPLEMGKVFNASFDKTWNAVLEVVKSTNGVIITNDKASCLVTYTITDQESKSKIYLNVYLKSSNPNESPTTVFIFPNIRTGIYLKGIDRDFYDQLKMLLGG